MTRDTSVNDDARHDSAHSAYDCTRTERFSRLSVVFRELTRFSSNAKNNQLVGKINRRLGWPNPIGLPMFV